MKVKKESYPPINMGISFMLVIFITLCMVVFAVLSFSTATKDYNYSKTNAENTTQYYNACNKAEEELYNLSLHFDEYAEGEQIEFYVDVDDSQALQIIAIFHPSEKTYTIDTWKLISTIDWEGDDHLSVIGSEH